MSGVTTMSFDGDELGERSISTHDVIVSDVSVIQFDVRTSQLTFCLFSYIGLFNINSCHRAFPYL